MSLKNPHTNTCKQVLIPACVYYVLYTLVFVVADKLSTGEPDLLWYTWGTQIINVPALPQAKQSKEKADKKKLVLVLFYLFDHKLI